MKVLHFNTYLTGGAAIAARRIHQGLLDSDVESYFLFKNGSTKDDSYFQWVQKPVKMDLPSRIRRKFDFSSKKRSKKIKHDLIYYLRNRPKGFELFSPIRLIERLNFDDLPVRPDIIHLHWIAGFFDYRYFFMSIPDNVPVVWTLHDMNPFTGGCHYSWECDRYTENCGNCPQLANSNASDLSREILIDKKYLFDQRSIHIAADSHWIEDQAKLSSVFKHATSLQTIHYGIETDLFSPKDKSACKLVLGINSDCKVIVFGADGVDIRRKGLIELRAALEILKNDRQDVFFLTFGGGSGDSIYNNELCKHLGHVVSADILSIIYSAADVFVMPSLYEAFGQVALEAMSCGVPVISFKNGGAKDMVIDGITGYLAERGDKQDLAEKLLLILSNDKDRLNMGKNARDMALNKFTKSRQAKDYINLYNSIVS